MAADVFCNKKNVEPIFFLPGGLEMEFSFNFMKKKKTTDKESGTFYKLRLISIKVRRDYQSRLVVIIIDRNI